MIFENQFYYYDWIRKTKPTYSAISLCFYASDTLEEVILWQCSKAKEYAEKNAMEVVCVLHGSWKYECYKMIGITETKFSEKYSASKIMDLAKIIQTYVSHVVVMDPDVYDYQSIPNNFTLQENIDFSDNSVLYDLAHSIGLKYKISGAEHLQAKFVFAQFGCIGSNIGGKFAEFCKRRIIFISDILRDNYGLVKSFQNQSAIEKAKAKNLECVSEISALHLAGNAVLDGKDYFLKWFTLENLDIIDKYPVPENHILYSLSWKSFDGIRLTDTFYR